MIVTFLIAWIISDNELSKRQFTECAGISLLFIIIYIYANKEKRLYNVTFFFYLDRTIMMVTKSWLLATVCMLGTLYIFGSNDVMRFFSLTFVLIGYVLTVISVFVNRLIQIMPGDTENSPRTALIGGYKDYEKVIYYINKTSINMKIIGYIDNHDVVPVERVKVLGDIENLDSIIRSSKADQIIFFLKNNQTIDSIEKYIDVCVEMGVTVRVIVESYAMNRGGSYVSAIGEYPMITYHTITLNKTEQLIKRTADLVFSAIGIVILSPIMLITALAVKMDSPGPVIFKQIRVAQNGRKFSIYKFRSMCMDAEDKKKDLMDQNEMQGEMFKMENDPRVTGVGKFIRKTSIDELPQLFNVVQGTMSLVGTRPPTLDEVKKYDRKQWARISIKPGITGLWQVSGRNQITDFDEVVALDLKYIDDWSIWLDIKILFKTVGALFERKGAY